MKNDHAAGDCIEVAFHKHTTGLKSYFWNQLLALILADNERKVFSPVTGVHKVFQIDFVFEILQSIDVDIPVLDIDRNRNIDVDIDITKDRYRYRCGY